MKNLTIYGATLDATTNGQAEILTLALYRPLDTQATGSIDNKADAASIVSWFKANLPYATFNEIARMMS